MRNNNSSHDLPDYYLKNNRSKVYICIHVHKSSHFDVVINVKTEIRKR